MKRMTMAILLALGIAFGASGCMYTQIAEPTLIDIDNNIGGQKSGRACQSWVMGLVYTGDASVDAAKKAGGVTKVHNVDNTTNAIFGFIWGERCTIVYGE